MHRVARCLLVPLLTCALLASAQEPDDEEVKSGPLQAVTRFLDAAHEGDFTTAANQLSLEYLPPGDRSEEGPRVARRLMFLLDRYVTIDTADLAKAAPGTRFLVGEFPFGRLKVPVELIKRGEVWLFSARTVRGVDPVFTEQGSRLWDVLPPWLIVRSVWILSRFQWLGAAALLTLGLLLARLVTTIATPLFLRLARLTRTTLDDALVLALERPVRFLLFIGIIAAGTRLLTFPLEAQRIFDDGVRSLTIAVAMWSLWVASRVVAKAILDRAEAQDEVASRAVRTQVTVLHRVANALVLTFGAALVLVQFPVVRSLGVSVLASAGVAGVVIGIAAQRSIGNLLAGIQLSFTQPMRIGDTVIVEGEWGWVEEITLTYVVVKAWDLRRLVLPISYFLEKPFQNWTRGSTEILGTVFVYADFRVDVEAVRAELARILEPQRGKLWNGTTAGLQVTEMTDRAVQLRALMSSDDSGRAWDLRCLVREQLINFLRQQDPQALPRVRAEALNGHPPATDAQTIALTHR